MNLVFVALYDRVLVRPADEHGKTKSGLWIPEIAKANKLIGRGEVIAVGAGRVTMEGRVAPLLCKVGDLAIYARQQGQPIPWGPDEEEVLVLREPDILGVYRQEPTMHVGVDLAQPGSEVTMVRTYDIVDGRPVMTRDWHPALPEEP